MKGLLLRLAAREDYILIPEQQILNGKVYGNKTKLKEGLSSSCYMNCASHKSY